MEAVEPFRDSAFMALNYNIYIMSRTPPASIRLTSGFLNYDQAAASTYYYQAHLKQGVMLDNIIRMLAKNVGFFTSRQKKKTVPQLVMGVLPLYTQLRAKQWYQRCFSKSCDWFTSKLFRGAQSSGLYYHNAVLYRQAFKKEQATLLTVKNVPYEPVPNIFQKLICYGTLRRGAKKSKSFKPVTNFYRQKGIQKGSAEATLQKPKKSLLRINQKACHDSQPAFLSKAAPSQRYEKGFIRTLFALKKSSSEMGAGKRKKKTSLTVAVPHMQMWSNKSLFVLFCLEQIIGKSNRNPSNFLQAIPTKPTTTVGYHNLRKKKLKTFYDIQLIRMLELGKEYMKIRMGHNFPRSQVDKLKPILIDPLQDTEVARLHGRAVAQEMTTSRQSDIMPQFRKKSTRGVKLLDFSRLVSQYKSNVTPKFWVCRRFNTTMKLNLFSVVEGRICRGHRRVPAFQRTLLVPSYTAGWTRLKSSFMFDFDVYSQMSNEIKSLRPTTSLRF